MTLPTIIDETATDDADTTPYERRGLYAVAVSEVPSADVEGRRAASVWGVIWRILAVVALLCCSIGVVVNRMVPVGVQTVFAVFLLVLMLGEIVPNELGAVAYVIRKRGSAYWLWPFAIIITWEVLFCTMMVVALTYGL